MSAALKLGIGVFSAVHDERYDLIFDFSWLPEIVQRYGLTPPG